MSKELQISNLSQFHSKLNSEGILILEQVMGNNDDGDFKIFFGFEDAVDEAEEEGYELESKGEAYCFHEGKIYEISTEIESSEVLAIFELDPNECSQFVKKLIKEEPYEGNAEDFFEENDWAKAFAE
jgi:hypothetical protein